MEVFRTAQSMRAWCMRQRCAGRTIGLVPTMGALHEGHLSLMRASAAANDVSVASIFVNPAQFAPHEDYDSYPRTWIADLEAAAAAGMDAIYAPEAKSMYPENYATYIEVERLQEGLCGVSRPHFFRGVATVVAKLFHAVPADRAYFGQKDAQQCAVVRRMVRDLDFGIEIVEMPIVRDPDGLALSSRNLYLSPEEREKALGISRGLFAARAAALAGERNAVKLADLVRDAMGALDIDYVAVVDAEEMTPLDQIRGDILIAAAARAGKTRLIDNVKLEVP